MKPQCAKTNFVTPSFRVVEILLVQPGVVPTLSGQPWAEGRCPVGAFRTATAEATERGSVTRSGLKARRTGECLKLREGGRAAAHRAALRRSRDGNARGALGGGGFGVGGHKSIFSDELPTIVEFHHGP